MGGRGECFSLLICYSFLGLSLQLSGGAAAHCSCSLKPQARMGLLGRCRDVEALELMWQEIPHQGWKEQFLHKIFWPTLRESEQGFTLCRGSQGGLQAGSKVNREDDIAARAWGGMEGIHAWARDRWLRWVCRKG